MKRDDVILIESSHQIGTTMKMQRPQTEISQWQEAANSWPWVREEWTDLPVDCRSVAVASKKIASLAPLLDLECLEELHLYPVTAQRLEVLGQLKKLKVLLLYDIRVESLGGLEALKNVEALLIMHAAKLKTLSGLESFKKLRALRIYHLPNVASLEPLAQLSRLRELSIQMSFGTDKLIRFDSLEPLGRLRNLEILELLGVSPRDLSLRPLARLGKLSYLGVGSFLPIEEYAFLAAFLPSSISDCLRPIIVFGEEKTDFVCRKCSSRQVGLVGKTSRRSRFLICPQCDKKVVDEHTRIFEMHLQASRQLQ